MIQRLLLVNAEIKDMMFEESNDPERWRPIHLTEDIVVRTTGGQVNRKSIYFEVELREND